MRYTEAARFESELFGCTYIVGKAEAGEWVYIWTTSEVADEIPANLLESPTCYDGAMIGTVEQITDEIENCVGSFRHWGTTEQQEESAAIVETLVAGIQ